MGRFARLQLMLAVLLTLIAGCMANKSAPVPAPQTSASTAQGQNATTGSDSAAHAPRDRTGGRESAGTVAAVVRVIDGDTIDVRFDDGSVRRVRYIGINTPERDEDFYTEATKANAVLVLGKEVRLAKDVSETDKYGRLLRYVYAGETFVNAELVKRGYAAAATYPPDVRYADYFVGLAAEARSDGVGLWSEDAERAPPAPGAKQSQSRPTCAYVGNKNSKIFHRPSCATLPAPHNRAAFKDRDEAIGAGYVPCRNCNP